MPKWLYPKPPEELMIPPRAWLFNHSLNVLGHARPSGTIHIRLFLVCSVILVCCTVLKETDIPYQYWTPSLPLSENVICGRPPGPLLGPFLGRCPFPPNHAESVARGIQSAKKLLHNATKEARSTARLSRLGHFKYRMGHQIKLDRSVCRLMSNSSSKSQHAGILRTIPQSSYLCGHLGQTCA